jgi:hypothetical protein
MRGTPQCGGALTDATFHAPTELERAFLRIVTVGYPELQAQVESCVVADYDPDGYCDIRISNGPPSPKRRGYCQGPSLETGIPRSPLIETLLWINEDGMLVNIEFLEVGEPIGDIYQHFVVGAAESKLRYQHDI